MTKEQLVRDHRLHPEEADEVPNYCRDDLLTANWDDYGLPVYQRADAAAGLPTEESRAPVPSAPTSNQPVVASPPCTATPNAGSEYKNPGGRWRSACSGPGKCIPATLAAVSGGCLAPGLATPCSSCRGSCCTS